jgi:hypothetical protein
MPNFILTRSSVILCPHGGIVTHIPLNYSSYRVNGEIVMLLTDQYVIVGCPGTGQGGGCLSVVWTNPSPFLLVSGSPALTNASIALCQSVTGVAGGPAIIASFQTLVREPTTVTVVN